MDAALSPKSQTHLRHLAAACVALILHVVAVLAFLTARQNLDILRNPPDERPFAWITLPPLAPEPAPPEAAPEALGRPAAPTDIVSVPEVILPQPPLASGAITRPPQAPDTAILGRLGQILSCGFATYDKLAGEEQERCAERLGEFRDAPLPSYVPTERERALTQRFARALAEKQAPLLLPCFTADGYIISLVTVGCLVDGAINGFDPETYPGPRYADRYEIGETGTDWLRNGAYGPAPGP